MPTRGNIVYRGNWNGLNRFLEALGKRTEGTPLVVSDNIRTALLPVEIACQPTAYGGSVFQEAPAMRSYRVDRPEEYSRNPQSIGIGEWLLAAYAMPFALWDSLWNSRKR